MTDILIRDLPDEVVAAIDAAARRLGLSRNEYLRRTLAKAITPVGTATVDDLSRLSEAFRDLADPDVMGDAWS